MHLKKLLNRFQHLLRDLKLAYDLVSTCLKVTFEGNKYLNLLVYSYFWYYVVWRQLSINETRFVL